SPGNTALSMAAAWAARHRIMPPRGPRSVLCVVVVTTSAMPTGDGCAPPATRPAMCAMSATKSAPTSRAISPKAGEVYGARDGGAAAPDQPGLVLARQRAHVVQVDAAGFAAHAVLYRAPHLAGDGHVPAVREVAAVRQRHAHDGLARLGERQIDR